MITDALSRCLLAEQKLPMLCALPAFLTSPGQLCRSNHRATFHLLLEGASFDEHLNTFHLDLNETKFLKTWGDEKKERKHFPLSFPLRLSETDFLKI